MRIFWSLLTAAALISCGGEKMNTNDAGSESKPGRVYAKGKLTNAAEGEKLYLEELSPNGVTVVDTAVISATGEFEFNRVVPEIGFYNIKAGEANFATVILDSVQTIIVEGNARDLGNTYTARGSKDMEIFWEINENAKRNYRQRDSLSKIYQAYLNSGRGPKDIEKMQARLQGQFDSLVDVHEKYVKSVIDQNPGSFATLMAIRQLNPDENLDYYQKVSESLYRKFPNSRFVALLHDEFKQVSRTAIGAVAPEITLPTPEGKELSLSSTRGKVVLLDFWASWCKPCRAENPNVVKLYNKYQDKGFTVFSVSLDKDHGSWVEAIKKDGLAWPNHVSDLKMWETPLVKLYNFNGIPQTFLLDKDGKIIGKNLRGEELEKKLAEIFRKQ
jgi:thiol-disulfide isomerase/thioredoxin